MFYQHKSLHYAHHGYNFSQAQSRLKNQRDYEAWKEGKFVPTERKLQQMRADGFKFPAIVKTVPSGVNLSFDEIEKPDLSFLSGEEESATEESFTTPVKEDFPRGIQQPSFTGVGGPQGGFRGFEPVPFKREDGVVKAEPGFPDGGSTPWGNSCQAVKTEVKPEPAVKDEV